MDNYTHESGYNAAMARLDQEIETTRKLRNARQRAEAAEKLGMLEAAREMIGEKTGTWLEREEHAKATILMLRDYYHW